MDEHERFGRPCLVKDRYLDEQRRGRIVRDLNGGQLVDVVLDGRRFPSETTRVYDSEVRELPSEACLFPDGLPLPARPSALSG